MHIAKGGYREDLKQYFRSKMEANICRYYIWIKMPWQYEPREFEFKEIKRGTRFYKPDFYLPTFDNWVEVKGYFRRVDKIKLRRFKKYYPDEFKKLRFIIPDPFGCNKTNGETIKFLCDDLGIRFGEIESYKQMEAQKGFIPGWE